MGYANWPAVTLIVSVPSRNCYAPAELDGPSMLALRDALNDALHDIATQIHEAGGWIFDAP